MEEIITKILDFIRQTGEVVVREGFRISVKQVYATAITELIWFFVLTVVAAICLKIAKKYTRKLEEESTDDNTNITMVIFSFVTFVVFLFFSIVNLTDAVGHLLAPEWYALLNIINLAK